jgi:hypothetical protein
MRVLSRNHTFRSNRMNVHRNARLTYHSRAFVVKRWEAGETPRSIASAVGVSPACVYKWLRRYKVEGEAGLHGRSSRPHRRAIRRRRSWRRRWKGCAGCASPVGRLRRRPNFHGPPQRTKPSAKPQGRRQGMGIPPPRRRCARVVLGEIDGIVDVLESWEGAGEK